MLVFVRRLICTLLVTSSVCAQPIVIGIAGGTASGKTMLAARLQEGFPEDLTILSQDAYFKNFHLLTVEEKGSLNWDYPGAVDFDLLVEHLSLLKQGKAIERPVYDFCTHSREDFTETVNPAPIIIQIGRAHV